MNLSHLIDTDWVIHYLHGNEEIVKELSSLSKKNGLAMSMISLAELYEGIYYSTDPPGNENALGEFLTGVSILGIDDEICRIFGRERGRLRKQNKIVSDFDLLIGSTCLNYNLTLLSNNKNILR
ncbi:MAG: type II toxin-antitoxin system VapC family toxin [Thermodesulfobacteriota bacterium]